MGLTWLDDASPVLGQIVCFCFIFPEVTAAINPHAFKRLVHSLGCVVVYLSARRSFALLSIMFVYVSYRCLLRSFHASLSVSIFVSLVFTPVLSARSRSVGLGLMAVPDEKSRQLGPVTEGLLAHVISILEDDVAREAYGQVYTQILCKVLEASRRRYL